MSPHICATCGHVWTSTNEKDARDVENAAQVNGNGPFCSLCLHIEMANRYAKARGFDNLLDALLRGPHTKA